jgi:hypothetical protein
LFGYIKPLIPELKVKEHELYKAFYCGLCKTMGKKISAFSRITLSYDMVFLCLVRTALTKEKSELKPFRCKLKPAKKRAFIQTNESLLYSSCVSAILVYYKCIDDINDTKNKLKKFFFFFTLPFFSRMKKKACKYYGGLEDEIKLPLIKLNALESEKTRSVEAAASCFAELMQNIACFGLDGIKNDGGVSGAGLIAKSIGYHLGRWLYIIDALDDFDKNIKNGEYNPFTEYYKTKENIINDMELIRLMPTASLIEMEKAFSLAGNSHVAPIISNIINLGLCRIQESILSKISAGGVL